MPDTNLELTVKQLRRICDPAIFAFKSTEELPELDGPIGQDRAVRAIAFGIDIASPGYHMYALGSVGTGRTTTTRNFLDSTAAKQPTPGDWCYVNNFVQPDKPHSLLLPRGKGREFQSDIQQLVEDLQAEIARAFESDDYQRERQQIQEQLQQQTQTLFSELEDQATARGFALMPTPNQIGFAPIVNDEVVRPDQLAKLDESEQERIKRDLMELQENMREALHKAGQLQKEVRRQLRDLDRRVATFAVQHLFAELREKYADVETVVAFLDAVQKDVIDNIQAFQHNDDDENAQKQFPSFMTDGRESPENRYQVNLIVDNGSTEGAPVIVEDNPSYHNLMGRIEHEVHLGALVTDFTMIKAGALHRANGGYLIIDAREMLTKPFAWNALKRALGNQEIKIEVMGQEYQAIASRALEPEPIPLDVKVILIGDPELYYMLYGLDEEFRELFKVKADFAVQTDWDDATAQQYARFIGLICRDEGLRHFDPSGVARLVEYSARMVGDQRKLSTKFGEIVDLVRQASYWSGQNGNHVVTAKDVGRMIEEKNYRSNRIEERIQEMIDNGSLLIDSTGESVGQINGISVLSLGDYSFGKPSRITARTFVGSAGLVSIDREIELGGRIHNKGTLILAGYLGGRYADETPLAFSASLTFEQLYEDMEGDSASSAELYALLSSLSGLPLRQDMAVTGSVNQAGKIQAIGGVNEKIEGFYDVCKSRGLTGTQGVMIPCSNIQNLMLRDDVLAAVEQGEFHVYAVSTVDEGIALLTGKAAGEKDADGNYPDGTVNQAVQQRLLDLAEKAEAAGKDDKD